MCFWANERRIFIFDVFWIANASYYEYSWNILGLNVDPSYSWKVVFAIKKTLEMKTRRSFAQRHSLTWTIFAMQHNHWRSFFSVCRGTKSVNRLVIMYLQNHLNTFEGGLERSAKFSLAEDRQRLRESVDIREARLDAFLTSKHIAYDQAARGEKGNHKQRYRRQRISWKIPEERTYEQGTQHMTAHCWWRSWITHTIEANFWVIVVAL